MRFKPATMTSKDGFIFAPVLTIIRYSEGDVDINKRLPEAFWERFSWLGSAGKVIDVHGLPHRLNTCQSVA